MHDSDILQIWKHRLEPTDFAMFIIRDSAEDEDVEALSIFLTDLAEMSSSTILIVRESIFSDFKKLSLPDLIELQQTIEEVIQSRAVFESLGDA